MKNPMRLIRSMIPLLVFAVLAVFASQSNAAPYGPEGLEMKWTQPSGEKLTLRVFGDEFYARTETVGGYTVVYNAEDRAYYYAKRNADGNKLLPTGRLAHLQPRKGQNRHIDLNKKEIRKIYRNNRERYAGKRDQRWNKRVKAVRQLESMQRRGERSGRAAAAATANAAPVAGKIVGLTILVQFPNDPSDSSGGATKFPVNRDKIVKFCNRVGYNEDGNTGSVRDYFSGQSLGKLTYTQDVTQIITMPHPRNHYNTDESSDDYWYYNYRDSEEAGQMLLSDAISVLRKKNFDFSNVTTDAEGNVVATNLLFAGPNSGRWARGLWPHQWSVSPGISVNASGKTITISDYQITNIEDSAPHIGTYVHESGHLLFDFPDLYGSYYDDDEGGNVGNHCLMGSGNWVNGGKTPAPINVYFKHLVGWARVTDLTPEEYVMHELPSTGNVACRILNPDNYGEAFYVENRGRGDEWAKHVPDQGIMIWHTEEVTVSGSYYDDDYTYTYHSVSLEQADGENDLGKSEYWGGNRGDEMDLYDLDRSVFSPSSDPSSQWRNGSGSGVRIKTLQDPGRLINVSFGKLPKDNIRLDNPNGGEIAFVDSEFQIRWEANIVGKVNIDLFKKGELHSEIASEVENTGTYEWIVPPELPLASNYKIRISTAAGEDEQKPVEAASAGFFEISAPSFPDKNRMPYGWSTPPGAAKGWVVTKSYGYEGRSCLKSARIGDGRVAGIEYRSDFAEGQVSFYIKVSSETGCDFARFFIDGVQQKLSTVDSETKGLSGEVGWTYYSFRVSRGAHHFKWLYQKDDSYPSGDDRAWIDGVVFPKTTQKIGVKNPNGKFRENDKGMVVFPDTHTNSEPKTRACTIVNRGKADLHGLKIKIAGRNPDSFQTSKLKSTALKPGEKMTLKILFAPSSKGERKAQIRIISNDESNTPFVVMVKGTAVGPPKMVVCQPKKHRLKNKRAAVKFGYSVVGTKGETRTITLLNRGESPLKRLAITKGGSARGSFKVHDLKSRNLAPGESTTFKVTFTPKERNKQQGWIKISNDFDKKAFNIKVVGNGIPRKGAARASSNTAALMRAVLGTPPDEGVVGIDSMTTTETIDGHKYLVLTATKPAIPDGLKRSVEVSPNLVDWFSGPKHTTVIRNNGSVLKVRDNTPVTPGSKRYIRLKTSKP